MPVVVGISLRVAGKIYYFAPSSERYLHGERVVVETARGLELGTVKIPPHEVAEAQIVPPLKPVLRRATAADISRNSLNHEREDRALQVCKRLVEKLELPMGLIDAQYTLDGSHVLIHFLAENRVDFRELVRELARELRSRIELRQVGVRDEAKLIGGYGICGRKLCCSAFLSDFAPVAISMAKEQGLALNPQKISGNCGRLMCCLAFECDQYRNGRADLPRINNTVDTPQGPGRVTKVNVMNRQVEVSLPDTTAPCWFTAEELGGPAQPVHACCATGGSGCGQCASTDAGESPQQQVTKSRAMVTERQAPTFTDQTTAESGDESAAKRKSRRRRKKPATAQGSQEPQGGKAATSPVGNDGDAKPKRPRRRKPRSANVGASQEKPAVPVSVGAAVGGGTAGPTPPVNGGRPRPRRRRPARPAQSDSTL